MKTTERARKRPLAFGLLVFAVVALSTAFAIWLDVRAPDSAKCRTMYEIASEDLEELRSAELQFRNAHGFFTTDLVAVGWRPATPTFVYGFGTPSKPDSRFSLPVGFDYTRADTARPPFQTSYLIDGRRRPLSRNALPPSTTVLGSSFTAAAVGAAGRYDTDALAVITIDEQGRISMVNDICSALDATLN